MTEERTETLYSLSTALKSAIDGGYTFDEETGEIFWSPDDVDSLELAVAEKTEGCVMYCNGLQSDIIAIDAEIARLNELKRIRKSKYERMRQYILDCVNINGGKPIETRLCRVSKRKSERVEILDETVLPEELITMKVTRTPNKILIKKRLKDGYFVPGAALVENESLIIK